MGRTIRYRRGWRPKSMRYLRVQSTNPAHNLALEEALFESHEGEGLFMLWQNAPSIIIGRHQNAWEEINRDEVERRKLPVVRRSTGGGAVYHDLGNLNFSFIEHREGSGGMDFARYLAPIVRGLARLGVEASISGRNDLEVGGKKISGYAQRLARGRVLHHGTLLVTANFEDMTRALNPEPEKYLSHGVASVRARVANISEYWMAGTDMEALCQVLQEEVGGRGWTLPESIEQRASELAAKKYGNWEWNMGQNPRFSARVSKRFSFGRVDVRVHVARGVISECRIYGDFFAVEDIALFERALCGCRAERASLEERLASLGPLMRWFSGCDEEKMRAFLLELF